MTAYVERLLDQEVPELEDRGSGIMTADIAELMDEARERIVQGRVLTASSADVLRDTHDQRSRELAS